MAMNEQGIRKSAILLLSLGEDVAAEVLKQLSPKEVQHIGKAMASLKNVQHEEIALIIEELDDQLGRQSLITSDQNEFLHNVLRKALGDAKAELIISKITTGADTSGIESLKWMDASTISELLRNEHPQVIAAVLAHLDPEQAGGVVALFTERLREDVMFRLATLDGIQPSAMDDLNVALSKLLSGQGAAMRKQRLGGAKSVAEVLNFMGATLEGQVIDSIREADDELAQKIIDEMFTFGDLTQLDDRGIQTMLREIQTDNLVIALKGAPGDMKERVFKNMSSRAAEALREDLENRGPMKLSEVEREQKEILKVVRRLIEEGQIVMPGKGAEEMI
jgi:flagellar motor switch protein FliG